jgi:signal transduction histidine kinase
MRLCVRWWQWAFALACLALAALPAAAAVIRVGLMAESQPFHTWPERGQPSGYDVDLLARIASDTGLRFEYRRYATWEQLLQALHNDEVQLVTSTARTPERALTMQFTRVYASLPQGFAGRRAITSVPSTPDLAGRRLAVARGFATESIAAERFSQARRTAYPTEGEALEAVERGEADFAFGSAPGLRALIALRPHPDMAVLRTFGFPEGARRLAVHERNAELAGQLDRALGAIDAAQFSAWRRNWLARWELDELPPLLPGQRVAPLRVGFFPGDRPYSRLDEGGQAQGIGIEMMKAVAVRAGIEIERFEPLELSQGLTALQSGRIDVMLGLTDTNERRQWMGFVGPYRANPIVLVSREQYTIWSLDQLAGRRLALLSGFFGAEHLRNLYPSIEIVACPSFDACLNVVERGEADAALYGLQGIYERLAGHESRRLRVTGIVGGLYDEQNLGLSLAREDIGPRLRDALEVVLRLDMPRIESEWAEREAAPKTDWAQVRRVLLAGVGLLLLVLAAWWWHWRSLRREIERTNAARAESEHYLAFMAHEVRNSLQSVGGAVALLRGSSHPDARQAPLLEALGRSARSTLGLLNGLLDRHRLHEGRLSLTLRPESIERVLQAVLDETQPAALAKGLALEFKRSSEMAGWWQIDALRVQQIVRNLLVNAVKFSDSGGIILTAALQPAARGGAWRRVVIEVVDQGPGLDAAQLARVFERFETAGGDRPGSGLGLALSRELARALGGTLEVASPPGQGARFTLTFDAEAASEPTDPRGARLERVLVVEDSPVYGMLLTQALANLRLTPVLAESCAQAREALIASVAGAGDTSPPFDLVLTDANLGDAHAVELLRFMRKGVRPGVKMPPVICMSADFDDSDGQKLMAAGAIDLLVKDSDVAAFAARVLRSHADHRGE